MQAFQRLARAKQKLLPFSSFALHNGKLSSHSQSFTTQYHSGYKHLRDGVFVGVSSRFSSGRITPDGKQTESSTQVTKKPSSIQATQSKPSSTTGGALAGAMKSAMEALRNPTETWHMIKDAANHYWIGSKLLWVEIKMATQILTRLLQGHGMTRRERMQLIRTTMDLFRLVPFAIFIIVPFMELLLPVALKLFPNMLPSTFQDDLKKEEGMKTELKMRLAVAGFMQETLQEMAKAKKKGNEGTGDGASGAKEVLEFIEKARLGEPLSNELVLRISRLFKDELTLANIARPQLVSMCRYMGVQPYGADAFLRFQLRTKLRLIKEDDRRILWEGIDSLTTQELREACQERGMRSVGLTKFGYKRQMQEWLDLSIQKSVPISLLIMSRAFAISSISSNPEDVLKNSMSSLDSDTINEIVLAVALPAEEKTLDMKTRKLESIQFQKEMIEDEHEEKKDAGDKNRKGKDEAKVKVQSDVFSAANLSKSEVASPLFTSSPIASSANESVSKPSPISQLSGATTISTVSAEDKGKKTLTVDEIQALGDLTRGSSVEREKAELAVLEASIDAVTIEVPVPPPSEAKTKFIDTSHNALSKQRTDVPQVEAKADIKDESTPLQQQPALKQEEDKNLVRMKSAVNDMLDKLKVRIDTAEKELGDKMRLLDKDNDGEVSAQELKEAMSKLFKRAPTEKEAEDIVQLLDKDKDGKFSVLELLQYIEARRSKKEVEDLEEVMLLKKGDNSAENSTKLK
jgi:LETM1 and EF-hand domain-containing protein 1